MVAERGRPRMAERIVDVLLPLIMEEIVEMVKVVSFQRREVRHCFPQSFVHQCRVVSGTTMFQWISERMTMESGSIHAEFSSDCSTREKVLCARHVVRSGGTAMFQSRRERLTRSLTALAPLAINIILGAPTE